MPVSVERRRHAPTGKGVDPSGGPVIDPTKNVLDLVEAERRRQDDLRGAHFLLMDEKVKRIEGDAILRAGHYHEVSQLRAANATEIRQMEAERLEKVRQVDVQAVSTTAAQSLAAIQTLAATASGTAQTLQTQLNTTAAAIASQLDRTVIAITDRLAALEKSSYEGKGKEAVIDPAFDKLLDEMKLVRQDMAAAVGKDKGIVVTWGLVVSIIGVIATMMGIATGAITLVIFLNRPTAPTAAVPGQVIYVPSPPGTLLPSTPPTPAPR